MYALFSLSYYMPILHKLYNGIHTEERCSVFPFMYAALFPLNFFYMPTFSSFKLQYNGISTNWREGKILYVAALFLLILIIARF